MRWHIAAVGKLFFWTCRFEGGEVGFEDGNVELRGRRFGVVHDLMLVGE